MNNFTPLVVLDTERILEALRQRRGGQEPEMRFHTAFEAIDAYLGLDTNGRRLFAEQVLPGFAQSEILEFAMHLSANADPSADAELLSNLQAFCGRIEAPGAV